MNIAIVHHHLRGGGVTRVISNAILALRDHAEANVVVISGEPPAEPLPDGVRIALIPELAYLPPGERAGCDAHELAAALRREARAALGAAPDIWHVHNHTLGKNPVATAAIYRLANDAEPLLLQIHDFAEDGRPRNYAYLRGALPHLLPGGLACLYPVAPTLSYAVLNRRDARILRTAGVPDQSVVELPNPVSLPVTEDAGGAGPASGDAGRERLILYPTRAIRRKNLGEFLLWAVTAEPGERFAVTLAPKNPAARPVYDRWVEVARSLGLPVQFEYGVRHTGSFPELLGSAWRVAATSVGEGFGLAFLEPWLVGRPLVGRDLPEITDDFRDTGIALDGLYSALPVPAAWVGETEIRTALEHGLRALHESYCRPLQADAADQARHAMGTDDHVDFGRLDEPMQERVLTRLQHSPETMCGIRKRVFGAPTSRETIHANQVRVRKHYSLAQYARRLLLLYHDLLTRKPQGRLTCLSPETVLDQFLAPTRFHLLRT